MISMNGINMLIQMFLLLVKGSHFPPEFDIYLFILHLKSYSTLLCDSLNFLVCLFFLKMAATCKLVYSRNFSICLYLSVLRPLITVPKTHKALVQCFA